MGPHLLITHFFQTKSRNLRPLWIAHVAGSGTGPDVTWLGTTFSKESKNFPRKKTPTTQWLFLVPLKGGRWHIIPQLAAYTTYILPSGGPHMLPIPPFRGSISTTIEPRQVQNLKIAAGASFTFKTPNNLQVEKWTHIS